MEWIASVPDVSCEHCARAIRNELAGLAGVGRVAVDVPGKRLSVQFDAPATWEAIETTLIDLGYPPSGA